MQGHQRYTLSLFRAIYVRDQSDLFEEAIQRREVGRQPLFRAVRDIAQIALKVHGLRNQLLNVFHASLRLEISFFLQSLLIPALLEHKAYQLRERELLAFTAKRSNQIQKSLYFLTASSGDAGSRCLTKRLKETDVPLRCEVADSRDRSRSDAALRHIQDALHGEIIRRICYGL